MTTTDRQPETETTPAPPTRLERAKALGWVLLALVVGASYFQGRYAPVLFTPLGVLEQQVDLVQGGRVAEAYELMSVAYRADHDLEAFRADVARLPSVYRSTDRSQYAVGSHGRRVAKRSGVYQVTCEVPDGSSIWTVEFVEDPDGEERILRIERWERGR